jgi:hypothetical protein
MTLNTGGLIRTLVPFIYLQITAKLHTSERCGGEISGVGMFFFFVFEESRAEAAYLQLPKRSLW